MPVEKVFQISTHKLHKCRHGKFKLDAELDTVECGICGEKLNPMWVLGEMAKSEGRYFRTLEILKKEVELTKAKTKCKCQKCGETTSILSNKESAKARSYY